MAPIRGDPRSADFRCQANASPASLFVVTQDLVGKPRDSFPEPA